MSRFTRKSRSGVALLLAVALLGAAPAAADPHDPQESGHPLEVIGTLLYPVGLLVDTVVFRPLHWVAGRRWVAPAVNHDTHHPRRPAADPSEAPDEADPID